MYAKRYGKRFAIMAVLGLVGILGIRVAASAHCDTMDGPVVASARTALDRGNVTPILKWVKPNDESAITDAFQRTLVVRKKGPEARELADMYFFETLVRVHRAGEGAPYTGLKPAGTDVGPAVSSADKALETGSADALVKLVTDKVADGIRRRFTETHEAKMHVDESIPAGRKFVASYVEFVHYVERLYDNAEASEVHHAEGAEAATEANKGE